MNWVTQVEFARRCNVSKAAVCMRIKSGSINSKYIRRDGTNVYVSTDAIANFMATSSKYQPQMPPLAWSEPDWDSVANEYIGPDWGPPPWSAEQWVTLAMVCDLAREAATHS